MRLSLDLGLGSAALAGGSAAPQLTVVVDTLLADATWTAPAGSVTAPDGTPNAVQIELWGAGGGGTTGVRAGGGGAYSRSNAVPVTPSTGYAVAGLAGGAANTNAADATFATTTVVAKGGLSGTNGGTGGAAASGTGDVKFSGGTGAAGTGNTTGGGGAGSAGNGAAGSGGAPDGGWQTTIAAAGRLIGNGGGSSAAAQLAGARGEFRSTYQVAATAGFPRRGMHTLGRDAANGTTRNLSLPSGSGGRLIVFVVSDGAATITMTNWTALAQVTEGTSQCAMRAFHFDASSADPVDLAIATSASEKVSWVCIRYFSAGAPTWTTASGSSTNANAPSHQPADGNYTFVCAAGWDNGTASALTSFPAQYGNRLTVPPNDIDGVLLAVCERNVAIAGAGENPAAFASTNEQWCAATLSVPAA